MYLAIQSYEKLIRNVRLDLSDSARAAVDLTLSYIRYQLPADILVPNVSSSVNAATAIPEPCSQDRGADESASRPRYLGEASDLRFFHTVRSILRGHDQSGSAADNDIQSYDHGTVQTETQRGDLHPDLPTKDLADRYIETYFYTIHIAYPFVSKPSFIERYERFWKGDVEVNESSSWLSLMCESLINLKTVLPHSYCFSHYPRYWGLLCLISSIGK